MFVVLSSNAIGQIKLQTDGKYTLGKLDAPGGSYTGYLYGVLLKQGGWKDNFLHLDSRAQDVRIWSTTNRIVFYNTTALTHISIEAKQYLLSSDARYKSNIEALSDGLSTVLKLDGVSYHFKDEIEKKSDKPIPKHYGFIAQEVEKVLPNLVETDSLGYKSVNYDGFLPVLVEALKELNNRVEEQNRDMQDLESQLNLLRKSGSVSSSYKSASLSQNQPNPYKESTSIAFFVPEEASQARIIVYNLSGLQILQKEIPHKGQGSISIEANTLMPGIYLYSLNIDGQEIKTLRMVVLE